MWQTSIRCTSCEGTHAVLCKDEAMPRVFAYACPETGERVDVRFRDPSRIVSEWSKVDRSSPESILVEETSSRGTFEA